MQLKIENTNLSISDSSIYFIISLNIVDPKHLCIKYILLKNLFIFSCILLLEFYIDLISIEL